MAKNLIVFYTDQLKKDHLGCYGNSIAKTPNIDALAQRGTIFDNHYAANPVCMPSRASFFTGRYLQAHRLIDNGIPLPKTEQTLPGVLTENGYRTHSVGKIHLTPFMAPPEYHHEESFASWQAGQFDDWTGPYYGFESVQLVLGHGDGTALQGGHYTNWVAEKLGGREAVEKLLQQSTQSPYHSKLPLEVHHSTWIADQAIEFLKNRDDQPFFLFVSFPDPHQPFAPPKEYFDMFADADFPPPHTKEGENDRKPIHWQRAMTMKQHPNDGGAHRPNYSAQDWQNVYAATYGMITLIDDSIGRVMDQLREQGLDEDTVVAFTADHGDMMGDHHLLLKGSYPCRSLLNIPFIVAEPGGDSERCSAVMSNSDSMPTFLDLLGIPVPEVVQGQSFAKTIRNGDCPTDTSALTSGWSKDSPMFYHHTLYEKDWRVTYYPNQDDGELYDLQNDPHELDNLFRDPQHQAKRDQMLIKLLRKLGQAEPNYPPVIAPW